MSLIEITIHGASLNTPPWIELLEHQAFTELDLVRPESVVDLVLATDGRAYARIIKYSKGFAIQKGKLAGFLDLLDNDEDSGEESVENDEDDAKEEAAPPAKSQPVKKAAASSKNKAEQEKPPAPQPAPEVGEPEGKRQRKETKRYA